MRLNPSTPGIGVGESARAFPTEAAALECLYLVTRSLDPTGEAGTMDCAVEACSECVCDHVRRSLARVENLLMETGRNTLNEIDPGGDREIRNHASPAPYTSR